MRRHKSLIPLTHDHHHALAQVRQMKVAGDNGDGEYRLNRARMLERVGRIVPQAGAFQVVVVERR